VAANRLKGTVVSVAGNGDLITDIPVSELRDTPTDERVRIQCSGHVTSCIFPAEHGQPEMTFVAVQGSSGFLELSLVGDDASRFLDIFPGAVVTLDW
jgi:S-adenosylmethionine hydrolase